MPLPTPPAGLQDLLDRAAIMDIILSYATGVDRRDWALYRSIFTDRIEIDFSTWSGMKETIAADEWVAMVHNTLACFDATQHTLTNLVITLDGDRARCVAAMTARHYLVESGIGTSQLLGGFYTDDLVRTASGWRIAACNLVITWEEGDRALFERAQALGVRPRIDDPGPS